MLKQNYAFNLNSSQLLKFYCDFGLLLRCFIEHRCLVLGDTNIFFSKRKQKLQWINNILL